MFINTLSPILKSILNCMFILYPFKWKQLQDTYVDLIDVIWQRHIKQAECSKSSDLMVFPKRNLMKLCAVKTQWYCIINVYFQSVLIIFVAINRYLKQTITFKNDVDVVYDVVTSFVTCPGLALVILFKTL